MMISNDFIDNLYGKTVSILGLGISNMPLMRVLVNFGATVTGFDRKTEDKLDQKIKDELFHHCVPYVLGEDYLDHIDADYIFRTPGMRPDLPQIIKAQENGAVLMSEMELFFDLCPCPIVAVTGSDGKTTTTTIIAEMLKKQGKTVHVGGNIGEPLIDKVFEMKKTHVAVVELSSFQLMTMKKSPDIAVITNLSPNHLDVHKDMEEYVASKENIFLHQNENNVVVLNNNCSYTSEQSSKAPSKVRLFSPHTEIENGVCCDDEWIYINENGVRKNILQRKDIKIVGFHNVENYMAAIAALYDMVDIETIVDVAKNFGGVEHRIEFVREIDGVKYYNDSIASSPTRTIAGFHSFDDKVILIAGGSDKHIPFDDLADEIIDHVKVLVLVGATAQAIRTAVENNPRYDADKLPVIVCDNLKDAVNVCKDNASSGDIVTMSPACASFDLYRNFMERGNLFKEIVNNL